MKVLAAFLSLLLCGCHAAPVSRVEESVGSSIAWQVREFKAGDAAKIVTARIKDGNWKFLAFDGGNMEPTFVPGLSKEEVQRYIDSGSYELEAFYYYHTRFSLGSHVEETALWDARMDYASRVNRRLLQEIEKKEPNQIITAQRATRVAD